MDFFRGKSKLSFLLTSQISRQASSVWDIACTSASGIDPVLNKSTCQEMASSLSQCDTLFDACDNYKLDLICELAEGYWYKSLALPYIATGRNLYDGSPPCCNP